MSQFVSEILFGYTTLISIINPVGLAFIFLNKTATLTVEERRKLAYSVSLYSFFVLVVAFFLGSFVLHMFGITLEALRIAGGLAVAVSGWTMLNAPEIHNKDAQTVQQIAPSQLGEMVFFPLTVPLTTGPGTVAAAIALTANRTKELREFVLGSLSSIAISALVVVSIYLVYSRADSLSRFLGEGGTRVVTRVSAFLLLCVGVQIILTGISQFIRPLLAGS
ncbi:MarC family protein [Bordetella pseudohinzii]|uniref:UPF0056 membrane protein n=1 Tax=Bordetella pseudohinzii TaxID=1331258 RepID=A0A0J6BRD8_9BORD|nr:MarC family protein [Bordetella pseudohinzii]ANY17332.1 antibiotic resistance protein [Bordetella pseudohinzii]KMM24389.1 antibiotic resistance protein [Bordetella pseudohinzii]KXA80413.1 antibiotic resistance protein [Bordetella pseudohinzii]KXA80791.1 antibiotic resistance protein [Bordetella pseudohinzii]CUI69250.1 inner membrane protein [Bordetella pseudohinzii]